MANLLDLLFGPPKPAKLAPRPSEKAGKPVPGKAAAKPQPAAGGSDVRAQALAQVRAASAQVMTPERAELLRKAVEVHRAKQKILADLSDEDRAKLVAMAITALLHDGREEEK